MSDPEQPLTSRTEHETQRLPTEILRVLVQKFRSDQDLVFLWTVLRNVNQMFRDLVEEWVRLRHLHTMMIAPTSVFLDISSRTDPILQYACPFENLSPTDPSRAVFSIAPQATEAVRIEIGRALQSACTRYPGAWDKISWSDDYRTQNQPPVTTDQHVDPCAFVVLRRLANDTELAGWTVNSDAKQIEIDWRETIGKLIWEEKLRGNLTKSWLARATAFRKEAQSQGRSPTHAIMQIAFMTRGARDESFTNARAKRIQRQKREHHRLTTNGFNDGHVSETEEWKPSRATVAGFERVEMLTQSTNSFEYSDDD